MNWHPIDFYSIVFLDRSVVDQLERYLQEKETRLAHQILNLVPPIPQETFSPMLPGGYLKLSDAVEGFSKKVRLLTTQNEMLPSESGEKMTKELNQALGEFAQVLEGCAAELFHQVKQVHVDRWHLSLSQVVTKIKDLLLHRMEELMWTIRRLENPVREYSQKFDMPKSGWEKLAKSWQSYLNPQILHDLRHSEKFLLSQYGAFQHRYSDYLHLSMKVEDYLERMKSYPILAILDMEAQNLYVDLFRLLKIWSLNPKPNSVLALEAIRSLKSLASVNGVLRIFREYLYHLSDAFFNSSLELKSLKFESHYPEERLDHLQEKVRQYQEELAAYIETMKLYQDFMLKTVDQRVRMRFRMKQSESDRLNRLSAFIQKASELNRWYQKFIQTLNQNPLEKERKENELYGEIDKILHEMEQPLISRAMMQERAKNLLKNLQACDEVGSAHEATIDYVGDVLDRALRADWKYHVLHEFPLFHEIYHLHSGLERDVADPPHAFRLEKFHELFEQIEEWANKGDIYSHIHEIELDINDIKIYLQDFYASLQRISKDRGIDPFLDETLAKCRQQLIEYRYLFGQFFFNLMCKNLDSQQLRTQFLFVDQYFESCENLLRNLTENSTRESTA